MAELVDALVSGTSVRKDVQVRVLFWAQDTTGQKSCRNNNEAQVVELVDTLL